MQRVKSPSICLTTHSLLCTRKCKKSGSTALPRHKLSTRIQSQEIKGSTLPTETTRRICIRSLRQDVSVISLRFLGSYRERKRIGESISGCVMLVTSLAKKDVRFLNGLNSMMMEIRFGSASEVQISAQPFRNSQAKKAPLLHPNATKIRLNAAKDPNRCLGTAREGKFLHAPLSPDPVSLLGYPLSYLPGANLNIIFPNF